MLAISISIPGKWLRTFIGKSGNIHAVDRFYVFYLETL